MSLAAGTRIGHYEILSALGAGGMGEVYRARDSRLERDVAIKALPTAFAAHADRLARFEREAKTLASLNHPNIAAIYGLEDFEGARYLILELVQGEPLSRRLARGPLSVRETLETGVAIAAAIEAAHERSIIHRDLKPSNVMLTPSRAVKVLDFGLAKAADADGSSPAMLSHSPTRALGETAEGMVVGTAAYMSPEQARGRGVDRRTDVWAFGCLLYECLTGKPSFGGETASDIVARILEREPDWNALPPATPLRFRELLRRCLTKEATERPRDIGDLRLELSSIVAELSAPSTGTRAAAAATGPSLAVLYFENLAQDKDSEYFCSGITEDILTDLSKIRGLRVASRNAVARYRGAPADIPRVADELSVGAVLEGSVRRAGNRVRITAQLIAADGFHLWAERYDRTLQDVFAVQEEIASSIAEALRVKLTPQEAKDLVQNRPDDVRAYDLYLRGRAEYGHYTREGFRKALELFREAIAIDPNYALAWAGIADSYAQIVQWGYADPGEDPLRTGLEAAERAINIDPKLAEAYKAKGLLLRYTEGVEAERSALIQAVEANPRFTPAIINLGVGAFYGGNVAETERAMRRALEIDPQEAFATGWLAMVLAQTCRAEEGIRLALRMPSMSSDLVYRDWSAHILAAIHLERNDLEAAERVVTDYVAETGDRLRMRAIEAVLAARRGRQEQARGLLRESRDLPRLGLIQLAMIAESHILLGEPAEALPYLQRTVITDMTHCLVRLIPALHPLLEHPPLAPRRWDHALVWPLEAPMIDAARHALFKEVRIESGRPQGSDLGLR